MEAISSRYNRSTGEIKIWATNGKPLQSFDMECTLNGCAFGDPEIPAIAIVAQRALQLYHFAPHWSSNLSWQSNAFNKQGLKVEIFDSDGGECTALDWCGIRCTVAVAVRDFTHCVKLYDSDLELITSISMQNDVAALSWAPQGDLLAIAVGTATSDNTEHFMCNIYRTFEDCTAEVGKLEHRSTHARGFTNVVWVNDTSNRQHLLLLCEDKKAILWDYRSGTNTLDYMVEFSEVPTAALQVSNSDFVIIAGRKGNIQQTSMGSFRENSSSKHRDKILCVEVIASVNAVATGGRDGVLACWSLDAKANNLLHYDFGDGAVRFLRVLEMPMNHGVDIIAVTEMSVFCVNISFLDDMSSATACVHWSIRPAFKVKDCTASNSLVALLDAHHNEVHFVSRIDGAPCGSKLLSNLEQGVDKGDRCVHICLHADQKRLLCYLAVMFRSCKIVVWSIDGKELWIDEVCVVLHHMPSWSKGSTRDVIYASADTACLILWSEGKNPAVATSWGKEVTVIAAGKLEVAIKYTSKVNALQHCAKGLQSAILAGDPPLCVRTILI